jgi:hypothetical protein
MESLTEFLARNHPPERNGSSPDQPNFVNLGKPADRSTLVRESAPGAHTVEDQHAMDYFVGFSTCCQRPTASGVLKSV